MMSARPKMLLAALMAVRSPEAAPGVEGQTQPGLGAGVSEQPGK